MTKIKQYYNHFAKTILSSFFVILVLTVPLSSVHAKAKKTKTPARVQVVLKKKQPKLKSSKKLVIAKKASKQKHTKKNNNDSKGNDTNSNGNATANAQPVNTKVLAEKQVDKYAKQFTLKKESLIKTTQNNSDLQYIVGEAEKRNMPKELAFLTIIESNLKQNAVSYKGAVGLWQFMPKTAKQFGLNRRSGVDERKDVKASTKAALTYLDYLHKKFDQDWMLALAAYNAGEGTVSRAIQRNQKVGKPTSFWSLKLPKQTREYVPKYLGLIKVIKETGFNK